MLTSNDSNENYEDIDSTTVDTDQSLAENVNEVSESFALLEGIFDTDFPTPWQNYSISD